MRLRGGIAASAYRLLDDMGIRIAVSRFFNWKNALLLVNNPSLAMKNAREYFQTHENDIKKVLDILSDDESKETYTKMIKFRQTMKYSTLPPNSYKSQYFGNKYYDYSDGEVFIDCGAFDGDTVREFKKHMKKKNVKKYKCICFEPDEDNLRILKLNHPDAICHKMGVWNECGELMFVGGGDSGSIVSSTEAEGFPADEITSIPVCSIDDTEDCHDATFIKMDLEGSEQMALLGAKKTIIRNKPKLAICIYHSDEDMIKIPLLIHEMVPEYKLWVRQHSNGIPETVLYATV